MTGGNPTVDADIELRLVERLQAGDATALEGLMERYSSRLYRLAFGITRNARDAAGGFQEVFLTVFPKIGSVQRRAGLRPAGDRRAEQPPPAQGPRPGH